MQQLEMTPSPDWACFQGLLTSCLEKLVELYRDALQEDPGDYDWRVLVKNAALGQVNEEIPPHVLLERVKRRLVRQAAGDLDTEHEIYHDDVVVEYPQSGERICGRYNIQALRGHHPSKLGFTISRVIGSGDLWVSEYVITYDGRPVYTVSIMEFRAGKVVRETQYFADPFDPPAWRAQWVERMG